MNIKDVMHEVGSKISLKGIPEPFRVFYYDFHFKYKCLKCNHKCLTYKKRLSYSQWEKMGYPLIVTPEMIKTFFSKQ